MKKDGHQGGKKIDNLLQKMKKGLYLFLIIIAAFIVRAIGINYGLPFAYHDDEPILVNYALAYGMGDFNPHFFNISPFLTYCLFFLYGIFFVVGRIFGLFHSTKDFAYLYLNNPTPFYLIGRVLFGLICGTLSVFFLYIAGKKYFGKKVALLAALFLAFNFLHVRDSHYLYFDIPLTLCTLIFFWKTYSFFSPARKIDYIALGALFGMAVSVKYQGVSLLLPFIVIIFYNFAISKNTKLTDRISFIAWSGSACLAVIFIGNPFLFLNLKEFVNSVHDLPYMPVSPLYHLRVSLLNGCGTLMVISGIIGMLWALIRRNRSFIIAAYTIFYYFLITKAAQPGERLVLPIVPFLLLFASFVIIEIYNAIENRALAVIASSLLVMILIYPSFIMTYQSDLLFLKEDTRTQAYRWIKENIEPKSKIALDATSSGFPRLEKDKEQIKELESYLGSTTFRKPVKSADAKLKFMLENPSYPKSAYYLFYLRSVTTGGFLSIYPSINVRYAEIEAKKIDFAVLSNMLAGVEFNDFVNEIAGHSTLLKTFSPYKEDAPNRKSLEMTSVPAAAFMERELFDRKSYGPCIKIYQIKK
ncbi:MAG: glycosyltransferase family 39 protein [Candidatus Omnitrophica bacterium]|nr:glycosyltransferase family 39 protein [Candidatus Omnitrophota bacterium]